MPQGSRFKKVIRDVFPTRILSGIFTLALSFFPFFILNAEEVSPVSQPEVSESQIHAPNPPETQGAGKEEFRFSGELSQETAYRLSPPHNFTKIKEIVKLDFRTKYNDHYKIKLGARGYYDAAYELTNQFPPDVNDNMKKEFVVRDAYLDIIYPKWNIRLGSQQIVWGEALGQFFADVVVPKDLREFLLPSFEYVRIPIWALDVQYNFVPNGTLEAVLTPDLMTNRMPLPGSEFAFFVPPPPPGVQQVILPDQRPHSNFKHWNGGMRVSFLTHGWDLAWFFYTSPDHIPVLFKHLSTDPNTGKTTLTLTPLHPRVYEFGTTFSKSLGPTILRGEFVYTGNQLFNAQNITTQNQGVEQSPMLRYVVGLDYPIAEKVDMNVEFQQQAILASGLIGDQAVSSWIFLRFETGFLDEKVVPELSFIVGLNKGDTEISPRLHYNVTKAIQLTWGMDLFTGALDQLYGEFRNHKRVFMNTQFKF